MGDVGKYALCALDDAGAIDHRTAGKQNPPGRRVLSVDRSHDPELRKNTDGEVGAGHHEYRDEAPNLRHHKMFFDSEIKLR